MPRCSRFGAVPQTRAQILGSRLHGEGYRKIWARLRHAGIRTSARRVRRLMGQHGLLAPHRVGRPEQRAHDGTITTTAVDAMWGTEVPSRDVLEMAVAVSGGVTVSRQAARSIMLLAGGCPRLCQPSTLRMLI